MRHSEPDRRVGVAKRFRHLVAWVTAGRAGGRCRRACAAGDVRSADPGLPPMGNRAAAGETKGVCEAIEGTGRANPPGNRDGGGKADKPDDRETGRRPHDLTPVGPG